MDSAKVIGENDDVIRIMSIHKSKGLEFPVVFLSGTGKQFNMQDLNNKILLHPEIGIGVKYIDYDRQIEYDTLSKQAMKNQIMLERSMNKSFQSEYAKIRYFCAILSNNLGDYIPAEEEVYITDNEYELVEIKYKQKKKRRSMYDLEKELIDG